MGVQAMDAAAVKSRAAPANAAAEKRFAFIAAVPPSELNRKNIRLSINTVRRSDG
jgi:hypothetical protein